MEKEKEIVHRVATSLLVSIDLEEFYTVGDRVGVDMKECLFQGMILKEKDFSRFYKGPTIGLVTRINSWRSPAASMRLFLPGRICCCRLHFSPLQKCIFGTLSELEAHLFHEALSGFYWEQYRDAKW